MPAKDEPKIARVLVPLAALREARDMSLRDVCDLMEKAGVPTSRPFMHQLEAGKRRASPKTLEALATVYELDASEIIQPEVPPADRARPPRRRREAQPVVVEAAI